MKLSHSLLALALFGAAGMAQAAGNCTVSLKGDDAMKFDLKEATVSASCATITLELTHSGKLPAAAMGHNVVIAAASDIQGIDADGMGAGAAADYIKAGDERVIAHSKLVGGGESASVSFAVGKLQGAGPYAFFCSFPGHSAMMKGSITVQ